MTRCSGRTDRTCRSSRRSLGEGRLLGLAHITGGGITDNLPRILPAGCEARIDRSAWEVPPVFAFLQQAGEVPVEDMYRTFNMGIGLIAACRAEDVEALVARLAAGGEPGARVIGRVVAGEPKVTYEKGSVPKIDNTPSPHCQSLGLTP